MSKLDGFMASDFIGSAAGTGLSDALGKGSANGPIVSVANSESILVGAIEGAARHPIIVVDIRESHMKIVQRVVRMAVESVEEEDDAAEIVEAWEDKLKLKYDDADKLLSRLQR